METVEKGSIDLLSAVKRHELVAFFVLTYAWSWTLWWTFGRLYSDGHAVALPFLMLGIFGPGLMSILLSAIGNPSARQDGGRTSLIALVVTWLPATLLVTLDQVLNEGRPAAWPIVASSAAAALIPAVVVAFAFSSVPGVRRHLATLTRPRGSAWYYLLALLLFAALWALGIPLSRGLGLPVPERELPAMTATVGLALAVAIDFFYNLLPNGLSEELGWRGFALPRLQSRYSPLAASVVLWVFWAVWHAPAYFGGFEAQTLEDTLVEWAFMLPVAIVFTWLYNRAQGSVLVTVLLHPAMNTASHFLPVTLGGAFLLVAFVVFVVVYDGMWRKRPA
jgi:membrane protease YdiL (CAAX protease family)